MENGEPLQKITRAVSEAKFILVVGNDAIVPLSLLEGIYRDMHNNPSDWPEFETGMVSVQRDGKNLLYILLRPWKNPLDVLESREEM